MKLFVSYGHGDYPQFFERLINDLRVENEVWVDSELRLGDNWILEIDKAIADCDLFIFIKTKRSLRPESYCFGELSYASEQNKRIVVLNVDNLPTPSIAAGKQNFDMTQAINLLGDIDEDGYDEAFDELSCKLKRLDSDVTVPEPFQLFTYDNVRQLDAMPDDLLLPEHILTNIMRWWASSNPYMAIFGNAASGKSTLSATLYKTIPQSVIHFFCYGNIKTLESRYFLQHIIAKLAERCPEFQQELEKEDFERDASSIKPDRWLSDYLIRPLRRTGKVALLILDGFDEITDKSKRKEVSELFFSETFRQNNYGDVLKIFVTSRNDRELKNLLASMGAEIICDYEKENLTSVKQIVNQFFGQLKLSCPDAIAKKIYDQSGGDFLYVKFMLEEIKSMDIQNAFQIKFPIGMKGVCQRYFDRIFDDEGYYDETAAPVLAVLVSVKTPISVDELQLLCDLDRKELRKLLKKLEMFVDVRNNHVTFVHKSLYEWLITNDITDKYYVDCNSGRARLCEYAIAELHSRSPKEYAREYGLRHLFEEDKLEALTNLLQEHERSFNSIFTSFIIEMIAEKNATLIPRMFRNYASSASANDNLTSEVMRILVEFGCERESMQIANYFCCAAVRQYYLDWISFHIAKRSNASNAELHRAALLLIQKTDDPIIMANLKRSVADIVREQGNYDQAQTFYVSALDIAKENELYGIYYDCEFALIDLLFVRGQIREAWDRLNNVSIDFSYGHQIESYRYHRLRGHLYHIAGNMEEALMEHKECLRISRELHYPSKQIQSANSCAEASPNIRTARSFLDISRRVHEENGLNRLEYGKSYYIESEVLIGDKLFKDAEMAAEQSILILSDVGYAGGIAHAHLERGKARAMLGNANGAIEDLRYALDYYKVKGTRPRFRFESYAYLLKAAEQLGALDEYIEYDDLSYFRIEDYKFLNELYAYVVEKRNRG